MTDFGSERMMGLVVLMDDGCMVTICCAGHVHVLLGQHRGSEDATPGEHRNRPANQPHGHHRIIYSRSSSVKRRVSFAPVVIERRTESRSAVRGNAQSRRGTLAEGACALFVAMLSYGAGRAVEARPQAGLPSAQPRAVTRTLYTRITELFAEWRPFVVGEQTRLTAHLTRTVDRFRPYADGKVTLTLTVEGST